MNVFFTVDVESYSGDYTKEVDGGGHGLPYILRQCRRFNVPATFFVEAVGATRWGTAGLARICRQILDEGHEVQLHVHPVVARMDGVEGRFDTIWRQDLATQTRLIGTGLDILRQCGVSRVTAFRAGSLAANADTLAAMEANGLFLSSNRDLDLKSSIESKLNDHFPVLNDLSRRGAVLDLPVTALRSPLPWLDGPFRHLEICAVGLLEMRSALRRLARAGYTCATILTHPGEFFYTSRGSFAPNTINGTRLESLLRNLSTRTAGEARFVSECLTRVPAPQRSPPLVALNLGFALARVAAQAAKRARHEEIK